VPSREKSRQGSPERPWLFSVGLTILRIVRHQPYVTAVFSDRKMAALIARWEPPDPNRMPI
jgi:hypothetical protein